MIQKARSRQSGARAKARADARREPVEVRMTLRYRFGPDEDETVTVMNDQRVPMVGSVFDYRDRILKTFTRGLVKAAATQPRVLRELMPLFDSVKRKRK